MRLPLFSPGWTTGAAASPRAPPPEAPPAASASERPGGEGGKRQGRKREGGEVSRHGGRVRGAWWLKREASNCRVDRWVRGEPRTDGRGGGNFFLSGAVVSDRGPGEKQQVLFRVCPEIPPPPRALTPSASCWANHASRILRGDETVGTGGAGRCRQREGRVITSSGGMMSNKPPLPIVSPPPPGDRTARRTVPPSGWSPRWHGFCGCQSSRRGQRHSSFGPTTLPGANFDGVFRHSVARCREVAREGVRSGRSGVCGGPLRSVYYDQTSSR